MNLVTSALGSRRDCLFSCMSWRLSTAVDCYCVCLNGRWTDSNGWTLYVDIWWKLVVSPCFCWKPKDLRTSPIRGRSHQTNTASSGGVFHFLSGILLSGCQHQLYLPPCLSWNNRAAGRTCPRRSLSVSRPNTFGSEWKGNTVHTQQYSFSFWCRNLPHHTNHHTP